MARIVDTGVLVFVTNTIDSATLETWVVSVAKLSGQPVDWGWCGGHARVYTTGIVALVVSAIRETIPTHDQMWRDAVARLGLNPNRFDPPRYGEVT